MPPEALYRYLAHYDIIPRVHPSPLGPDDPSPPAWLLHPELVSARQSPPPVTAANRPRRDPKESSRRRASRALAEEELAPRDPVLADKQELHIVLADMAQRHFRDAHVKEVDTLAAFMCTVKAKRAPPVSSRIVVA
jgi:hypothetical protein